MGSRVRRVGSALAVALGCALASDARPSAAAAAAGRPLETAVYVEPFDGAQLDLALRRIAEAGATSVRLLLSWRAVAPSRPEEPRNHEDPAYRWDAFDARIERAAALGLKPLVTIWEAPAWAEGPGAGVPGTVKPDPAAFGAFATAAASRYAGRPGGRPRVRHWQAWNEPNLGHYLAPQFEGTRPFAPRWYRRMVNAFAAGVRSVHRDNVVVAGGTSPFRDSAVTHTSWGPLGFVRELLCIGRALRPTCRTRVDFDVWAHHPYTEGPPRRPAVRRDDVSLADLPELREVLVAAAAAGHVTAGRATRLWVTEFSWDTSPPDPRGVPVRLHARWVAEALHLAWQAGVSLFTWFKLCDDAVGESPYQSGLYFHAGCLEAEKPALAAFRFPLVARAEGRRRLAVWGRTPHGRPGDVLVEQSFAGGWRTLGTVATDEHGILARRFAVPPVGRVRARTVVDGIAAVPFSLRRPREPFVRPFGS